MPSGGRLHCGRQMPPVDDGGRTSAQGCKELRDWLHTGEEVGLQLEAPHILA